MTDWLRAPQAGAPDIVAAYERDASAGPGTPGTMHLDQLQLEAGLFAGRLSVTGARPA